MNLFSQFEKLWIIYRNRYESAPKFNYRPLTIDPALAKRRLFRSQQLELDRKLTMLIDRGTPRFIYGSLQLYGTIDNSLS